jgi:hypothetical protein
MIACIILFDKYSYSIYRIHMNKEMRKAVRDMGELYYFGWHTKIK